MTMVANSIASPSPVTTADIETPPNTVNESIMSFEAKEPMDHINNDNIVNQNLNHNSVQNHDDDEEETAPGCSACRQLHSDIQISIIRIAEKLDRLALRVEELFAYQQQQNQQAKNNNSNNYNEFLTNNNDNQHTSILDINSVSTAAIQNSTLNDTNVISDSVKNSKKFKVIFNFI